MPTPPAVLLEALVLAAAAGALCCAAALRVASLSRLSGHLRHFLLCLALLVGPASLVGLGITRPGPVGCLVMSCSSTATTGRTGDLDQHYAMEAAGKFPGRALQPPLASHSGDLVPGVLLAVWSSGLALLTIRLCRRRWRVLRLRRESGPVDDVDTNYLADVVARRFGLRRAPALVHHPDVKHPMVGGSLRPTVFLPVGFSSAQRDVREMVLLHELAHVRRRDFLSGLLGEVTCALFWFDPLAWVAARRAVRVQEVATDSCVVQRGVRPSRYAEYLLRSQREMGRGASTFPATLSIAGDCLLTERICSVLDPSSTHHRPPSRRTYAAGLALFAAVVAGVISSPGFLADEYLIAQEHPAFEPSLNQSLLTTPALDSLLRPVIINRMTDRYVAGTVVSIVHDGRLVYAGGFGDREVYTEDPVDPSRTIFRIGSITKAMTGVAVMQLVQRGLVDLDADVNLYLRDVRVPDMFEEPVRVRHLLTHTGGFDQIGLDRHAESPEDVKPLDEWLGKNIRRIRPPGEVSAYDTYGISLAGHLVEQVSGLAFEEYLRSQIFLPLAMHRSGISIPPALGSDVALGYGFAGEWEVLRWEHMNTAPASSVSSTATDMAHFAIMLLAGGRFEGQQVLDERSVDEMLSRQYTNDPDQPGYGYTFFENDWNGVVVFSHAGSMAGFAAMLYLIPDYDLGIFIACNQESSAVIDPVLSSLMEALFPDARPPQLRRRYRSLDPDRFVGSYANNVYHHADPDTGWVRQPFELEANADGTLVFDGETAWPVGPLTFQRQDGLLLSFRADSEGRVTHLFVKQAVYEKLD